MTSQARGFLDKLVETFYVSLCVGSIVLSVALYITAGVLLIRQVYTSLAWAIVGLLVLLAVFPLGTPQWASNMIRNACIAGKDYFSLQLHFEDEAALAKGKPFIIGLEPHSALPTALPGVFSSSSPLLPPALQGCHCLASDVCFKVPLVRHVYWWCGVRPVSKASMCSLLQKGKSVVLVPGGVQECLHMQHDREVAFLRRRTGFVRLAMQQGVQLLPVFAFGQTATYSWARPGPPLVPASWVAAFSRAVGLVPMLLWGRWGTFIPHKARMTVVVGKPIKVPHVSDPSKEEVEKYLGQFIESMQDIYEKHKEKAGYAHLKLQVL